MASLNSVNLVGRLVADPKVVTTKSGKPVASFAIAVESGWGENKKTSFIDVTAWNGAEAIEKYVSKGSSVGVVGKLEQQNWEQEGQKRSKIVVIANEVVFLETGAKKEASSGGSDSSPINLDDIPF